MPNYTAANLPRKWLCKTQKVYRTRVVQWTFCDSTIQVKITSSTDIAYTRAGAGSFSNGYFSTVRWKHVMLTLVYLTVLAAGQTGG